MRRVVVTGIGMVTPLGCGVELNWKRLIRGDSGIARIRGFDSTDLPSKIAGQVPEEGEGAFHADEWMSPKEQKRVDRFILLGLNSESKLACSRTRFVVRFPILENSDFKKEESFLAFVDLPIFISEPSSIPYG